MCVRACVRVFFCNRLHSGRSLMWQVWYNLVNRSAETKCSFLLLQCCGDSKWLTRSKKSDSVEVWTPASCKRFHLTFYCQIWSDKHKLVCGPFTETLAPAWMKSVLWEKDGSSKEVRHLSWLLYFEYIYILKAVKVLNARFFKCCITIPSVLLYPEIKSNYCSRKCSSIMMNKNLIEEKAQSICKRCLHKINA